MNITLRQIRYFVAVAGTLSVSAAARDLGISQSAVTTALQQLEDEIGARLLLRTPRGVTLTQEGHQFLRHAQRIMGAVTDAGHAVRAHAHTIGGTLTLGVTSMVAGYYLADLLARYRRIYPQVTVKVVEDQRRFIEHLLINGEVDVAILICSALENHDALASEVLLRSPCRVWLPANHPLLVQEQVSQQDLAGAPIILLTADDMHELITRHWRRLGLHLDVVLNTSSVEAVRSLVGTGLGIAVLPDMAYRPWSLEGDRIEVRPLTEALPTVDVGLTWRKGSSVTDTARFFIELAREHARARAKSTARSHG
ncbi:LysR family transcriptional regulator [Azospirillum sp. ST 5-10]|uniref:LysR family transcriptional regulator n=1 Tax=unclassified Azospirillum TaxID=2630922 RepID=UPI003F4A5F0E